MPGRQVPHGEGKAYIDTPGGLEPGEERDFKERHHEQAQFYLASIEPWFTERVLLSDRLDFTHLRRFNGAAVF